MNVKKEYEQKSRLLAKTQAEAEKEREDAESIKKHQKELVKEKAEEMYNSRKKALESAYKGRRWAIDTTFFGSLLYGGLCTVFTAVRSECYMTDFKTFFVKIWSFLCLCFEKLLKLAKWASQVGDLIPQDIVALIVHWFVMIVVVVLISGGAVLLLYFCGDWVYQNYKSEYADTTSLAVALISLAVTVFFAEPIKRVIPINLLLLLIITHVVYVGLRWGIPRLKEYIKYH